MTITLIISKEVINKDTNDVMLTIVQLETKTWHEETTLEEQIVVIFVIILANRVLVSSILFVDTSVFFDFIVIV
jgi:hypothetical protein